MLATWASHIKDAAREGQTQYVLEELVKYDLAWRRRTTSPLSPAYSILLTCCATGDWGAETIRSEHVDLARALLDRGADPNYSDVNGWAPLYYAARGLSEASVDMVALLLDAGGNARATNSLGGSPLLVLAILGFSASEMGRPLNCRRIVRMLLRASLARACGHGADLRPASREASHPAPACTRASTAAAPRSRGRTPLPSASGHRGRWGIA